MWHLIKEQTGTTSISAFQQLSDEIKRNILKLLKENGASHRQLERLTGVGRGLIENSREKQYWMPRICPMLPAELNKEKRNNLIISCLVLDVGLHQLTRLNDVTYGEINKLYKKK